jgi:Domain of unknown function (DUF4124)
MWIVARWAAVIAVLVAAADVQGATIYRCRDNAGGVLYSDEPCRGGVVLNVQKSAADPRAIERLRLEVEAFHQRQAARDAAANEAARQQLEFQYREAQRRAEDEYRAQREAQNDWYYFAYWPWPFVAQPHLGPERIRPPNFAQPHMRPKPIRSSRSSLVPARPVFMPAQPLVPARPR